MPLRDLRLSEAEAHNLVRVLRDRQWAGEDDISLVLWLAHQFQITPHDAASLYDNFRSGFDFGLDPVMDSIHDDSRPMPPSPQNLTHHAAFELGKISRDEVRDREEVWDKRLGYSAIVLAVAGILQAQGVVPFPLALVCTSLGGLIAGAMALPNPLIAGIGGGAATGAICSLALHGYSRIRTSPSVPELVLLTVLPAIPGVLIGMLLKGLYRKTTLALTGRNNADALSHRFRRRT